MNSLEEQIKKTVDEIAAGNAVPAMDTAVAGTFTGDPVAWLAQWTKSAAECEDGFDFAHRACASLADLTQADRYAIARTEDNGEYFTVDFHGAGAGVDTRAAGIRVPLVDPSLLTTVIRTSQALQANQTAGELVPAALPDSLAADVRMASTAVVPLNSEESTCGAIMLGSTRSRQFSESEMCLLESVGHLASAAISRTGALSRLSRQESMLRTLHGAMDAMMIVVNDRGEITDVNPAACLITGFEPGELIGRSLWSALLVSDDLPNIKKTWQRLKQRQCTERFESFVLTKRGSRRRASWSVSRFGGDNVAEAAVVCTAIDITERCEALDRATRAEAATAQAREMFTDLEQRIKTGEKQIEQAAEKSETPQGVSLERRARARRQYPYNQLIAPLRGTRAPDHQVFMETKCHDISSRGFSFVTDKQPDYERVVVAFGTPPMAVYLTADVRHVTAKHENGLPHYVVGCRYTGRVRAK